MDVTPTGTGFQRLSKIIPIKRVEWHDNCDPRNQIVRGSLSLEEYQLHNNISLCSGAVEGAYDGGVGHSSQTDIPTKVPNDTQESRKNASGGPEASTN